jgi:peptide/nickel transport system permease protein
VLFALVGPALAAHGPTESDFVFGASADTRPVGPCRLFPLGADPLYRDVFARLSSGARVSLLVACAATAMAVALGTTVGVVAGWLEGKRVPPGIDVDAWLMRLVDVLLAFPFLLSMMAIGAALEKTTFVTLFVTLGATSWLGVARLLRAKTLEVRSLPYIEASRALGQSTLRVLQKHVLPNVAGPLIVASTLLVAQMIVADSVLNYLGIGLSPPTPTWGRMLLEGQDDYSTSPWLVLAPAAAILISVWGFNMLGEGLRDALDPREI